MSSGVWLENAPTATETDKDDNNLRLEELRLLSEKVFGSPISPDFLTLRVANGKKRVKTGKRVAPNGRKGQNAVNREYPHRDTVSGRNCKIAYWDDEIRHLEYSPQTSYKVQEVGGINIVSETHYKSTKADDLVLSRPFDPEWLVTTFMGQTAQNGKDALKEAYRLIGL